MLSLFEELRTELVLGATKKGHPFRYFSLATTASDNTVGLRTVVLRRVSSELHCTFYSDSRSKKIREIQQNRLVSALFLHPKKLWQITIKGEARIEEDPEVLRTFWNGVPGNARKDYTTNLTPGTPIGQKEKIEHRGSSDHFTMVHIVPKTIEFLKLGRPEHSRIHFSKEGGEWLETRLVP